MNLKKMIPLLFVAAACVMPAGAETFEDHFTDNVRDKTLWLKPQWSDAMAREADTHLRFYSHPTNSSLYQMAGLIANFGRKYNKGDTLNVYSTVRIPHKIPSDPGGAVSNSYEIGIGLFQSPTNSNFLELTVRDSQSNRQFGVYYLAETMEFNREYWSYPAPTNVTVFLLRMSYSSKTDNVNFYWAEKNSSTWTKIRPALKMADLFGPSNPKIMTPYAIGYMENVLVPADWNIWLDDFIAVYNNRPL